MNPRRDAILAVVDHALKNGTAIPLDTELEALRFHLADDPARLDLKRRMVHVFRKLGLTPPADLVTEIKVNRLQPEEVLTSIRQGTASRESVFRVIDELSLLDELIPPEIEAASLRFYIEDDGGRLDLKRRLVALHNATGIHVSQEVINAVEQSFIAEERETDFQAMMHEYAAKVEHSDMGEQFLSDYAAVKPFTMTPISRLYALWDAVRYVVNAEIKGVVVECGVWRGGSMMLAAKRLISLSAVDRDLYLYDTFEGLPRPDESLDIDILGNRAIDGWTPRAKNDEASAWAFCDDAEVTKNLLSSGYPTECVKIVKGMVEDTIPRIAPDQIALLRIDTDWHHSYRHILNHFYDRVSIGGVIIFDDYGQFLGARKAVDEFIEQRRLNLFMLRVDFSCRLAIKTSAS